MVKTFCALALSLTVFAINQLPAFAAENPGSKSVPAALGGFSVTPTIGGYFFAKSEQRDAIQSYGLKIGYEKLGKSITDNLGIECSANYFSNKSKADKSDDTGYLFRLDVMYPFIVGTKWMPFLSIGAGGIVIDSVSHADTNPLFNYGAGLKYFIADYLAARVDARHLLVYSDVTTRNNFEVGFGVSYYFGKESIKKVSPAPARPDEKEKDKSTK